jgi:hypothetical protein
VDLTNITVGGKALSINAFVAVFDSGSRSIFASDTDAQVINGVRSLRPFPASAEGLK